MPLTTTADVQVFQTKDELVVATEQWLAAQIREALAVRPFAYIAISGGSTPKPVYERMSALSGIDWGSVHVCFVDERNVPPSDKDSNYRMVREAWFDSGVVPASNIHRMQGELDAAEAAVLYEAELHRIKIPRAAGLPVFDAVLLGMGPDGHTASLFPDTVALNARERWVTANWVPKLDTHRITLTFPSIDSARNVAFMVAGDDKAEALAQVLSGQSNLPAARITPRNGRLQWLVDAAAARVATTH
jgi:6-phosphogluconolactonase